MRLISALACMVCCVVTSFGLEPEMVRPETLPQGFVLIVKDSSGMASQDNPIFLASSINGWDPSDIDMILSGRSDTRWQIVIDRDLHGVGMQFKFALGSWDREELDEAGESIPNRSLGLIDKSKLKENERPVIEFVIPKFRIPIALSKEVRQRGIYRALDVTGNVKRVEVRGGAGGAEASTRDLLVWLPEGYDDEENAGRDYPVIYMFDGQNLFDQLPGVAGEWNIDETLTSLIDEGRVEPLIVVGIPHSGEFRTPEYMPIGSYKGITGDGAACMDWVIAEVMPRINSAFRIKQGCETTAIGGASLGGSMALYGSTVHPDLFGMALIESLPMIGKTPTQKHIKTTKGVPFRFVMGMGGSEVGNDPSDDSKNQQYVDWANEVNNALARRGRLSKDDHKLIIGEEHVHNENAWSARFGEAIEFLFPAN